jgi:acyl carrier protein
MTREEFILALKEEFNTDELLTGSTIIKDLDGWDSMEAMMLIGFVSDEFDIILTSEDIKEINGSTSNSIRNDESSTQPVEGFVHGNEPSKKGTEGAS